MFDHICENRYRRAANALADSLVSDKYQMPNGMVDPARIYETLLNTHRIYDYRLNCQLYSSPWFSYIDDQLELLMRCVFFNREILKYRENTNAIPKELVEKTQRYCNEHLVVSNLLHSYHPSYCYPLYILRGFTANMYGRTLNALERLEFGPETLAEISSEMEKVLNALASISIELYDYIGPYSRFFVENVTFLLSGEYHLPDTEILYILHDIKTNTRSILETTKGKCGELRLTYQKVSDLQRHLRDTFDHEIAPRLLSLYRLYYLHLFILISSNNGILPEKHEQDLVLVVANIGLLETVSKIISEIPTIIRLQSMRNVAGLKGEISKQMTSKNMQDTLKATLEKMEGERTADKMMRKLQQATINVLSDCLRHLQGTEFLKPPSEEVENAIRQLKSNIILSAFQLDRDEMDS